METSTKKISPATLKLALKIFKSYAAQWAAYEADCEDYAKQGYRPSHCFHGVSLWTDYDPMCGPCEDGYGYFDPNAYRRIAIDEAVRAFDRQQERIDMLVKLMGMGAPIQIAELGKWATEPVQSYYPQQERKEGYAALAHCEPPF
jgi:hypothetical protein